MMEKPVVRSYTKSKMPRMQWAIDLHRHFVHVVEQLGGERKATPKKIVQAMGVRNLTISHVKSHLQMYRNKKQEESVQAEKRVRRAMRLRQSQQQLQIYKRIRDATKFIQNQRRLSDIREKITAFPKPINKTMEVSCKSLFQSSRIGLNEIRDNTIFIHADDDVVVAGDGANIPLNSTGVSKGEEKLSLELTLGLKL